ncbi:hypothetical protein [Streptomyces tsukubensis]|uniref:hypothetical protein n=1 Tax=Streptomyces tsukubensis TaxID=83656 RepID=UPI00344E2588
MTDREWFRVETAQGQILGDDFPNRDSASTLATTRAGELEEEVFLVKCTTKRVRHFQRHVTVKMTEVPTTPQA